ncbi:MAG: carboxypeptidase-like regulatory domain-containing protein, partial [Pyrinomonadaceae bacterium]
MNTQSFLRSRKGLVLSALLVLLAFSSAAFAQQGTSTVRGTVKDQQGNVVAGAAITLTNLGTNNSRTATSNEIGAFSFESVPVGDYKMEVEGKGFKKALVTDVHASVGQPTGVNVDLEIGNVAETVTVAAGSAELLVNREDATLGNTFVNKQITQLPLEARNVPNLLTLQAATTRDGYVAGSRADQSNITLDGVDINEAQTNTIIGADPANGTDIANLSPSNSTVLRLNSEAIEEFRVTTTNPNANQGRSSGAQVALVTKSGSNEWHGALFEFYRTSAFSANNFFNNKAGHFTPSDPTVLAGFAKAGDPKIPRPPLIRHTFGGALGGPIVRNKAFFFYSYEADRITQSTSALRNVPLPSLGRGEVKYLNPSGGVTTLTT